MKRWTVEEMREALRLMPIPSWRIAREFYEEFIAYLEEQESNGD